jgi:hypothetical protein
MKDIHETPRTAWGALETANQSALRRPTNALPGSRMAHPGPLQASLSPPARTPTPTVQEAAVRTALSLPCRAGHRGDRENCRRDPFR